MFKISELKMKFIFVLLKIVFENSKNTKLEKDMFNLLFTKLTNNINIEYNLKNLSIKSNYNFYYEIINKYLKSSFIIEENKKLLKNFILIIKKKIENK